MQATRFDVVRPCTVDAISVALGGSATGTVTVHVFGQEGSIPVPILEHDLIAPIALKKTEHRAQNITLRLPKPISITGTQFFIAVTGLPPGITLLSDSRRHPPRCSSGFDEYRVQYLKMPDGHWEAGVYGYAIDAIVSYRQKPLMAGFADITTKSGLTDSLSDNESIAWYDVDNDKLLDLMASGRLYRNNGDGTFDNITSRALLSGSPRLNLFIDMNNDHKVDILFLGCRDSNFTSYAFINNGDGTFRKEVLDIPRIICPTAFCVEDINKDNYPDIFIGQWSPNDSLTIHNFLLVNNGGSGFIDNTQLLLTENVNGGECTGAQWVDIDHDGVAELYIANDHGVNRVLRRDSLGHYVPSSWSGSLGEQYDGSVLGGHWADYDNDGTPDALIPRATRAKAGGATSSMVLTNHGAPDYLLYDAGDRTHVEYNDKHAGGTWGDADNNGLLDFILTTSCDCRYISLYMQQPGNAFLDRTVDFGLGRVSAGKDAIWVDIDNDGKLDFITISDGYLRVFRNTSQSPNSYVALDVVDRDGSGMLLGTSATVYAGGHQYTRVLASGRGLAMQDPPRFYFGLGTDLTIDSITVLWGGNPQHKEVIMGVAPNGLYAIHPGEGAVESTPRVVELKAFPNPFSDQLHIEYELTARSHINVSIFSTDGRLVKTIIDEIEDLGNHEVQWEATDNDGKPLSKGIYIYRLRSGDVDLIGRAVLVR